MELKTFVAETLRDILLGITDAQKDAQFAKYIAPWGIGAVEFPPDSGVVRKGPFAATVVRFDVGLTVEDTDSAKAGGGLKIAIFNAGVEGQSIGKNTAVNRIQFAIHLGLPPGDGDPATFGQGQPQRQKQVV
jgi:hypothetical protein